VVLHVGVVDLEILVDDPLPRRLGDAEQQHRRRRFLGGPVDVGRVP
jgi:hypothetical protein